MESKEELIMGEFPDNETLNSKQALQRLRVLSQRDNLSTASEDEATQLKEILSKDFIKTTELF